MTGLNLYDENKLLLQVASGDERAFGTLFRIHHHELAQHIFRLTESLELTEEVVQDVFLKIWIGREALAEVRNFRAYLFVASKNHALNCLKRIARERVMKEEWAQGETQVQDPDPATPAYDALIDEAIDRLPPQQQKVYLLSRHERLKYAEIAARLELSRETVKKYLQLAVNSIRLYIQNRSALLWLLLFFRGIF